MGHRGRKRKAVAREPNGRASRRVNAQDAHVERIQLRMRQFGLTEEQARDQKAETVIGRRRLHGRIWETEWEAAMRFKEDAISYSKALMSPRTIGAAQGGPAATEDERYAAFVAQVRKRHEGACAAVQNANVVDRGRVLYAALDYVVVRDLDLPHLFPDADIALRVLARYYGLEQHSRAA